MRLLPQSVPSAVTLALLGIGLAVVPTAIRVYASQPPPPPLDYGNLLANPGFEPPYAAHGANEVVVATGWSPWFDEVSGRPEFKDEPYQRTRADGSIEGFSARVHHGEVVQKFFTSSRSHDAGMYQVVTARPGDRLLLSAWVRTWSSDCDDPCVSPREACPGSTNSHGTYFVQVGLEPEGRVPARQGDPAPPSVVWSGAVVFEPYDDWTRLEVEVTARTEAVTAYLRGHPLWPVKHNDSYWDDARLQRLEPMPTPGASLALPVALRRKAFGTLVARGDGSAVASRAGARGARSADMPLATVPAAADVRIEYPIRSHPGQENFALPPTCAELPFESLVVRNLGASAVDMDGWTLTNRAGDVYRFPPTVLEEGGRARVWTRSGADSRTDARFVDLYWGRDVPAWANAGDEAVIRDSAGTEVARRGYP